MLDFAHEKCPRDFQLTPLVRYGDSEGLVPIALYRKEDGWLEDLGEEGFRMGAHVDNYIGRVFQKYREAMKLNQKQFEEVVSTSHSNISQYESGVMLPKLSIFERISDTFGLEPKYLLKPPIVRQFGQLELPLIKK